MSTEEHFQEIRIVHSNVFNECENSLNKQHIDNLNFVYTSHENKIVVLELLPETQYGQLQVYPREGMTIKHFKIKQIFNKLIPQETHDAIDAYIVGKIITKEMYVYCSIERAFHSKVPDDYNGTWKHFYGDGTIKSKGTYENGIEKGEWIFYNKNGIVYTHGNFIGIINENLNFGDTSVSSPDGKTKSKRSGKWTFYNSDKTILMTKEWSGVEQYECVLTKFRKDSTIEFKGTKVNEQDEGESKYWYSNGQLSCVKTHINFNNTYIIKYNEKGVTMSEGNRNVDFKTGLWKYYYENGNIFLQCEYDCCENFVNEYIMFYPCSGVKERGMYVVNNKQGEWMYFHKNSVMHSQGNYDCNKQVGVWRFWNENEQKMSEGEMTADGKQGLWQYWHENGEKQSIGSYVKDKKHGVWNYWFPSGNQKEESTYVDGTLLGKSVCWYDNEQKRHEGVCVLPIDNPSTEWDEWYEDGTLKLSCHTVEDRVVFQTFYSNGKQKMLKHIDPIYKRKVFESVIWHKNGNLKLTGHYNDDKKCGIWTHYDENGCVKSTKNYH
jgi:antitoxin component YwqK of YwqJK toxin-antitoxin module